MPGVVKAMFPSEEELIAKCLELGLVMRRPPAYDITHPAITLAPLRMSAAALAELKRRQLLWNEAVDRTARDFQFLSRALKETAASDKDFTGRLVSMMQQVYMHAPTGVAGATGPVYQPLMLGIFRSDYMRSVPSCAQGGVEGGDNERVEETADQWKNVEINTVSCSFAGLSPLVGTFHDYIEQYQRVMHGEGDVADQARQSGSHGITVSTSSSDIPASIAAAAAAWSASVPLAKFCAHHTSTSSGGVHLKSVVLVVIQENERNTGDQYKLIFELLSSHGLLCLRRTHSQLHAPGVMRLVSAPGETEATASPFAVIEDRYVASVVYFRSAYVPQDFPSEGAWQARLDLERCNAIKCPSLPYHLLTFKKLQQMMTDVDGVLTPISFAGDAVKARTLASHFMAQYSLNAVEYAGVVPGGTGGDQHQDPEEWIKIAIEHPEQFVLKPQLEGGGNLIAGEEMRTVLRDTPESDPLYHRIRKEYILMRKIAYPTRTGYLFRQGTLHVIPNVCSELGIFGTIVSDGTADSYVEGPARNQCGGHVVRTKPASEEDGGVMAGVACLDSIYTS